MSVGAYYDAMACGYDALVATVKYIGPAWLDRMLPSIPPPIRAADFGCANGGLGQIVRRHFPAVHLTGFDVSEEMIKQARLSDAYNALYQHDLNCALPLMENASINLAIALGFTEFLDKPLCLLGEISRLLTPGGTLLISFQEHWPDRAELAPRIIRGDVLTHRAYSVGEITDFLTAHAFTIEGLESITGYVGSRTGFAFPYSMVRAKRT